MKRMASGVYGRISIFTVMGLVAVAAILLASVIARNRAVNFLSMLSVVLLLPWYLLTNPDRPKSIAEIAAAVLAMAFLAWGASTRFRPYSPPAHWDILDAIHCICWSVSCRLQRNPHIYPNVSMQTMRWKWGLLAAFYALIVLHITARRPRHLREWVGSSGTPRSAPRWGRMPAALWSIQPAAAILGLWFLSNWLMGSCPGPTYPYGSCPFEGEVCGWVSLAGFAGSLSLAVADPWRRGAWCHSWRFASMDLRPMLACGAGIVAGLGWSLWGWRCLLGIIAFSIAAVSLDARLAIRRRRQPILTFVLAMFWGFAISAEVVQTNDSILIL